MVVALPQADPAETGQGAGLALAVTDVVVVVQGLLDLAEVGQCAGLTVPVAGCPVPGQGLLQVTGCLVMTALMPVDNTETDQRVRLGRTVAGTAGGPAGVIVDGDRFGEAGRAVQISEQGRGQANSVAGPAVLSRVPGDRDQAGKLDSQPLQRRSR